MIRRQWPQDNTMNTFTVAIKNATAFMCQGISKLLVGQSIPASWSFNYALALLRMALNEPQGDQNCLASGNDGNQTYHKTIDIPVPISRFEDERFHIYCCAKLYSGNLGSEREEQREGVVLSCAVAIFNLALSFHQLGKAESSMELYHTCAEILVASGACRSNNHWALMAMEALNNEACLYFHQGRPNEFHRIMNIVAAIKSSFTGTWSAEERMWIEQFTINVAVAVGSLAARCA